MVFPPSKDDFDIDLSEMSQADLPWNKLMFGYHPTQVGQHVCIMFHNSETGWSGLSRCTPNDFSMSMFAEILHYGTGVFEGMTVQIEDEPQGGINLLQPWKNYERMKNGAEKMGMKMPDRLDFFSAVEDVLEMNQTLIPPAKSNARMYLRPMLFSVGEVLGLTMPYDFVFVVLTAVVGPYFQDDIKLQVWPTPRVSGDGDVKGVGQYWRWIKRVDELKKEKGYHGILFPNVKEWEYPRETQAANIAFLTNDGTLITPPLQRKYNGVMVKEILPGVTRDTVFRLASVHPDIENVVEGDIIPMPDILSPSVISTPFCMGSAATIKQVQLIEGCDGKKYHYDKNAIVDSLYEELRKLRVTPSQHNLSGELLWRLS